MRGRPKGTCTAFDKNSPDFKKQQFLVESLAAGDCTVKEIADKLNCSKKTIERYFGDELAAGHSRANKNVKAALYRNCLQGDTKAQMFWLQAYGGVKLSESEDKNIIKNNNAPIMIVYETDNRINPAVELLKKEALDRTGKAAK